MENTKIGTIECILTLGCVAIIPLILTVPTFTIQTFGSAALSHTLYIILVGILLFSLLFHMFFKFKNKDILDISEFVGGKFLKYVTGIIAICYLVLSTSLVLSEFNENIRNIIFENTPANYIYILFAIGLIVGVFSGIKGIFRASTIIAPVIILSILFIFFSLYNEIDITNYFHKVCLSKK